MKIFIFLLAISIGFSFALQRKESVTQAELDAFEKWFWQIVKIDNPKVALCADEETNDIAVCATRDLKADEELIKIPYNLMITADRILQATPLKEVLTDRTDFTDTEIIAMYLMYLSSCEPEINPFITWLPLLPERYESILYFKEDEVKALEGSLVYDKSLKIRERAKSSFDQVKEIFKETTENFKCELPFTYDNWRWALSTVRSRKVDLVDSEKRPFQAVVPFFDFFNHVGDSNEKFSWGYSAEHKFFHAESLKATRAGSEVLQFYGSLGNAELLLDYGFVMDNNPFDSVLIDVDLLGVDPEDSLYELKDRLLSPYRGAKSSKLQIFRDKQLTKELLTAVQIINAGEDDFEDEKLKPKKSIVTEYYVAVWFQAVAGELLGRYPTKLKADEELMKQSQFTSMSPRMQNAIKLRAAEKRILNDVALHFAKFERDLYQKVKKNQKAEL